MSYDDTAALAAFGEAHDIPYPLLSDADSAVIKRYGILNTLVEPREAPFHGIPFPSAYLVDTNGVVVEKFFPRHLANRESPETIIDSALGAILADEEQPYSAAGEDGIRVKSWLHGGALKSGMLRRVIVRFELPEGLHIYGPPVPDGMVATTVR